MGSRYRIHPSGGDDSPESTEPRTGLPGEHPLAVASEDEDIALPPASDLGWIDPVKLVPSRQLCEEPPGADEEGRRSLGLRVTAVRRLLATSVSPGCAPRAVCAEYCKAALHRLAVRD